jgi:hypothetical protein
MMKKIGLIAMTFSLVGCMTMTGNYTITAKDIDGKELSKNIVLTAQGRRIYLVRNALCSLHPNAIVMIKDSKTGEELKSESPYQCPKSTSKNTNDVFPNNGDISSEKRPPAESNGNTSTIADSTKPRGKSIYQNKEEIENELKTNNNGTTESRIRLFGQNGISVILYRNSKCAKESLGKEDERVSGGLTSAFSSFIGAASNTSIGIPETETTKKIKEKNGPFSKAYFREYVIEANKPVAIEVSFQDVSHQYAVNGITYSNRGWHCSSEGKFVPIAGADYELAFNWNDGKCDLRMNRIAQKDGVTILKPVEVAEPLSCNKKANNFF